MGAQRLVVKSVLVPALAAASIAAPLSHDHARAWLHTGCRQFNVSVPNLKVDISSTYGDYTTAANYAVSYWNNTSPNTEGLLTLASTAENIKITTNSSSTATAWAQSLNTCGFGAGEPAPHSQTVQTYVYTATTDTELSLYQKRLVLEHEIGHAYGLAHVDPQSHWCTYDPAVMENSTEKFGCAGPAPWLDDVEGVNARYP